MSKIVGLNAISGWLIGELKKIEGEDLPLGRKNQKVKRACERAKRDLWVKVDTTKPDGDSELVEQESGMINESTYNSYLTRLRRRINEAGIKSFTIDKDLDKLKKDCKPLSKQIAKVDFSTAITIRLTIKPLKELVKVKGWWAKYKLTEKQADKIAKVVLGFSGDNKAIMEHLTRDTSLKERTALRAKSKKRRTETMQTERKLSVIKTIELATLLLKSRNWEHLTIGIALATGRRASEVLHFGIFEAVDKARFKFSGQRKNRSKANDVNTLPCIVDSKLVVEAVELLRGFPDVKDFKHDWKGISEAEQALRLNNRSHAKLGEVTNDLMQSVYEDMEIEYLAWVFKDTRAAYAHTSLAMYEARENSAGREFKYKGDKLGKYYFQKILLHTSDETSELYEAFTVLESKNDLNRYQIDKARERGNNSYFADRLDLLKEWKAENDRKAFDKYLDWCIEAITKDPTITINNTILRTECKGRVTIVSEFARELKDRKLDRADLILVIPEDKEPETKRKVITVSYTVTFNEEIEIEIEEDENEDEAIDSAIRNHYGDLNMYDGDMEYDIDDVEDLD